MRCYESNPGSYVATRMVELDELNRYGVLKAEPVFDPAWRDALLRVEGLVEKPRPSDAPSRFGVFGRYLFEPIIFDILERTSPDRNGEIQITDALSRCCHERPVYGYRFEGKHYDVGNKLGFLEATIEMAFRDPDVSWWIRQRMRAELQET
jgi:UTP--glucose-1-phosphate uridylyltransferase